MTTAAGQRAIRQPRNPFGRIARVWSDDEAAAARITEWLPVAHRKAAYLSWRHPQVDWEPIVMTGLYEAAYTYRPGSAGFFSWFTFCTRGLISGHARTIERRSSKLLQVPLCSIDPERLTTTDMGLYSLMAS